MTTVATECKQHEGVDITGYRFAAMIYIIQKHQSFLLKKTYISKVCVCCSSALLHLTTVLVISTNQDQSCLFGTSEKTLMVFRGNETEIRIGFRLKN